MTASAETVGENFSCERACRLNGPEQVCLSLLEQPACPDGTGGPALLCLRRGRRG